MALHVVERLIGEQMAQITAKAIDFQTALTRESGEEQFLKKEEYRFF